MQFSLEVYQPEREEVWESFIYSNTRNATFLHSRAFFLHNGQNAADDISLMFYKNGKLRAVLPAASLQPNGKKQLVSHPRSTYGGFITDHSVGVEDALEIVEATVAFAKEHGFGEVIVRNPFRIFHQFPTDETDYAMWFHGFTILKREVESVVQLQEDAAAYYDDSTRRSIKKAWKSVTVKETDDFAGYWNILTENLKARHQTAPTHELDAILRLRSLVGSDRVRLFGAFADDKMVAGIVVFVSNKLALQTQYIASDSNYQQLRPLNAVIDHLIQTGYREGFRYLNLGTSNEEDGKKINAGLFRFKEGFGAKATLRETMHLVLQ
jgi:hypothetical protein